ncbi:MAG: 3-dehydroquinate synthase [Helicobacter sp.]|nr:3-dehydroquinate synthase [Helicobacter sp.]MDE5816529.1 3-dehydroquinate synthase [Helicobacter sp.]MDE7196081.1 3-dehydroquinate synthase [Helicobacter sp.]
MDSIHITTPHRSYPIHFGALAPKLQFKGKVLVVSNSRVSGLYLDFLLPKISAPEICICIIEDGEQYKTLESVQRILETAFVHRLDRKSTMIALGGGVVGDIVGFAAGIFMRGIDFVQIPTTLLAQVDASIGGKTGINNAFGKNLIGLFHQPASVHIDPFFLQTLPAREFAAGVAEIVKMAVTFDAPFFEWLWEHHLSLEAQDSLLTALRCAISIKQRVVCQDEKEQGLRAALNYGHTFGHAIEKESGYGQYLHGEAVSMGIVMVNALACKLGCLTSDEAERICALLQSYNLPTRYKIANKQQFYHSLFLDKKTANNKIKFILPDSIGNVLFYDKFTHEEIMNVLEQFCDS